MQFLVVKLIHCEDRKLSGCARKI